jgi:hypothetical protein
MGVVPENVDSFAVELSATSSSGAKVSQSFTVNIVKPEVKGVNSADSHNTDPFHPQESMATTPVDAQLYTVTITSAVLGASAEQSTLNIPYMVAIFVLLMIVVFIGGRIYSLVKSPISSKKIGIIIERGRI